MLELNEYLKESASIVEKRINEYIKSKKYIHPILSESMLYSINSGGKRIRPALSFIIYEMLSGKNKIDIIDAASAIEMVHTYSLIHDDLPAMDNDDLRRGKPTNHKVFGEGIAILAGDSLLTDAFHIISSSNKLIDAIKAKVIEILSFRAGGSGMISGQVMDLLCEKKNFHQKKKEEYLKYIHLHKTADMIIASAEIGAVCAQIDEKTIKKLRIIAKNAGLIFQIVDDVLDVIGDKKKLGKKGSDIENEKLTFVSVYGVEKSMNMAEKIYKKTIKEIENIDGIKEKKELLKNLVELFLRREK
jgi:geranylgeranyl diphosphate synthase type II